jgi:hypothetical protein
LSVEEPNPYSKIEPGVKGREIEDTWDEVNQSSWNCGTANDNLARWNELTTRIKASLEEPYE